MRISLVAIIRKLGAKVEEPTLLGKRILLRAPSLTMLRLLRNRSPNPLFPLSPLRLLKFPSAKPPKELNSDLNALWIGL